MIVGTGAGKIETVPWQCIGKRRKECKVFSDDHEMI